jgi:WD40 repeat protein
LIFFDFFRCIAHFEDHSELITDLTFSKDGKLMVTSGLDEVLNVYSLESLELLKTIPLYEVIHSQNLQKRELNLLHLFQRMKQAMMNIWCPLDQRTS